MDLKKLSNNLTSLSTSATFRQSVLTSSTVFINGLLGALFFIFVARVLGPADFGLFTIAIATTALIADIADFGTNTGIIRFIPKYLKTSHEDAYKLLKLSLEVKAAVWLVVLTIGLSLASFISSYIFEKPELTFPLQLGFLGVGGAMLFSFTQSTLQAFEKYRIWSFVNITANFLRLVIVLLLALFGLTHLNSSLTVYLVLPFFGFFLGLCFLPVKKITNSKNEGQMLKDFRSFNFSVGIFTVIAAISGRLDTYLAARILRVEDVGIYGAAVQLNSFILQIIGGIGVVVAPKFASFDTKEKMVAYLKKLQLMVTALAVILLLGSPLAVILIPWFYGSDYQQLPVIFLIYLLGMLVYLISVPVHTAVFYYYSKPQLFIYTAIGHLLLILVLGVYLTQKFGLMGLTIAVCLGMVFNFVIPLFYVIKRIKENK